MRVLVVQTAHLGDVVLTTPLLRVLAREIPDLDLTVLTTPTGRDVLEGLGHVRRVLVLDKRSLVRKLGGTLALAIELRRYPFDAVLVAQRSSRSGLFARSSGARRRIGFRGAAGERAYTERVAWRADTHALRRYIDLAEPLVGAVADIPGPEVTRPQEADERMAARLAADGIGADQRVACVAPGAAWNTKRWRPEGFAEVVAGLSGRGWRVVLVGSSAEADLCRAVAQRSAAAPLNLAGRTSIADLAAVLARAALLVGNDSGTAHVAAAVGTPVVSVFGPTVPRFGYTPWGSGHRVVQHPLLTCRPCHHHGPRRCPLVHHRCMQEISTARVLEAVDEIAGAVDRARSGTGEGAGSHA